MYKTVVFDLDGTLLNTLTDLADAGNRLCRKYGWPTHERQAYQIGRASCRERVSSPV